MGWFKFKNSTTWYNMIQIGNDGGFATCVLSLYLWQGNKICLSLKGYDCTVSGCTTIYTIPNPISNTWYHIAASYDGTLAKIYLNGDEVLSTTPQLGSYTTGTNFYIGGTNNYYLNGFANDIRYYNNALTAEEIKKIAQGLILHYPLNNAPLSNLHSRPSILPPEYQEVEYIESTGNEYINTGWVPTVDCGVVVKGAFLSYTSSAPMIGSGSTGGSRFFPLAWTSNQSLRFTYGNAEYSRNYIIGEEIFVTFNKPARKLYINGELKHTYGDTYTVSTNPLYLFGTSGYGGNLYLNQSRLWFVRIFDNGDQIKRNLVPCYRISDKKPGMYDTVNGVFYTNASGSGEFKCGPLIKSIPNEYISLNYIESTGTQYLNINRKMTATSERFFTTEWTSFVNGNYGFNASGSKEVIFKINASTNQNYLGGSFNYQWSANKIYNIYLSTISNALQLIVDGEIIRSSSGTTAQKEEYLFAYISSSSSTNEDPNTKIKQRYWHYYIRDNGIPVRDFRPALRISDKKPGMYDLVNDVFYINEGTGEFNYSVLTTEYDISGYRRDGTYLLPNTLVNNDSINKFKRVYNFTTSGSAIVGTDDFNTIPEFTYSCWIKPSATRVMYNIAGYRQGNNSYRSLSIDNSLGSGFHTYISGSDIQVGAVTPSVYDNKWHMLTVTYDGTTIITYTDGIKTNERAVTLQQPIGSFSINYPDTNNMNRYYVGDISDVRVYATALDSEAIQELYNMGKLS